MICDSVGSGLDDQDNLGHLGHFFAGQVGLINEKKLSGCDPDRSREINSIAFSQATGLHERVACLDLACELPSLCICLF